MLHVLGASGFIGGRTLSRARKEGLAVRGLMRGHSDPERDLDLTNPGDYDYGTVDEGDTVLVAAAISSPDLCAREPQLARQVNVLGTIEAIHRMLDRGASILFLSSDTVYGEADGPVWETTPPDPFGRYAEGKAEVEQTFAAEEAFSTLRLAYVFGKGDGFTNYLLGCMDRGEQAEVFNTLFRSVVHVADVVAVSLRMAQLEERPRVLNVGGPELLSRLDMAERFAEAFPSLRYRGVSPPSGFLDRRPAIIDMRSNTLSGVLGREPSSLRRAIPLEFPYGVEKDTADA